MASAPSTACFLIVVLLVLSHELVSTEGRTLREISNIQSPNFAMASPRGFAKGTAKNDVGSPNPNITSEVDEYVGAFRPTTPGHSPGIGHSIHN